jgi:hypothetical protein
MSRYNDLKKLFSIWAREADVALEAKAAGAMNLPIMKEYGQHVHVDVTLLRRYEDLASDVKNRLD